MTAPPIAEMFGSQQTHTDQHIDRSHDVAPGEQLSDNALDPPEHRIVPEVLDRNALCQAVSHALHKIMVLLVGYCGHHVIHIPTHSTREHQGSSNASFTPQARLPAADLSGSRR